MSEQPQADLGVEVLEQIYRHGYRRFLRVALAIVGNRETASEVVQEAFARALRSRFEFRGEGAPEGWVWTILVNHARSVARDIPSEAGLEDVEESAVANGHAEAWPEVRAAVAALPENRRERLAVFLRHYADMDYEQAAIRAGVGYDAKRT